MKKKSKKGIIEAVSSVLLTLWEPKEAIELRFICMIARVSEEEAFMAINHLIKDGYKIKLTDGYPHKFYFGD